jgi:hypothetical protein
MVACPAFDMIRSHYAKAFGADLQPAFAIYRGYGSAPCRAALGYRRAGTGPLLLESYLDQPIEDLARNCLDRPVCRDTIVEIGNFAADNALAMIALWGSVSNDLAADSEVAVATLTLPLRRMFRRIGIPFHVVADAHAGRAPIGASDWGDYYNLEPQVCIGEIALAQQAIEDFMAPRRQAGAA